MHTKTFFELLHETSRAISSEIETEKLVQKVTDLGTELINAKFGAFFYNAMNADGEAYVLYTISGVSKEHFSKFPMPRNTQIFEPNFSAKGTVRYDDVTEHPHFGQNSPHFGMPNGHWPIRSYLAAPVVSPLDNKPVGGIFFGHPEPGVFTEESEKLIEGVAIQAAIAMTNAKLYEEKKQAEKKLLEQREQYRSIFNATSDSAIIYDENGFIVEANPSACEIFGYGYEELIGIHASKLFKNPQDFEVLKEIALSGRHYSGVHKRIKKDGTLFDVEFKGSSFIFKGKPHVLSVVKVANTQQQLKEAEVRREQMTNIIGNVSPVTLWMTNKEGETIYFNKTWIDWVGGTIQDHLGFGWLSALIPEERDEIRDKIEAAYASRKLFTIDFRIRRRTGKLHWCSSHGSPYFDKLGSFAGYAGSLTDITDRKSAEEQLERQNVLISTITNNTQQALFLMDDKQFCTYMNPAAEHMTGFTLAEVKEKPLHYYVHHTHPDGRHFPIEDCPIDRALPTKNQTQGEEIFIHKSGRFFPVAFTASPIVENGKPIGTVIEARDTTEEKQIQEELRNKEKQAMAMLEEKVRERTSELEKSNYELLQFTSVASHDLKEPLRKISIFSRMLEENLKDQLDAPAYRQLKNIINSADRMKGLIDDLLAFSRLSHAHEKFDAVDLNVLIRQIIDDLEIPIREKNADVSVGKLPTIQGIHFQMGQVFQNLLSNSLKFVHPDRKPVISVSCQEINNGQQYNITYRDNGIGFNAAQSEKIFEVFFRLHSRDNYEGTGVGLAIVRKIIELHNGTITATSEENQGATFEIVLPKNE